MATSTLTPHYEDNDMDYRDLADFARQSLDRAMDANRSIAMRQMEVLSMQADETQALLQSGNLTNEQFDKVMQESEKIRQAMSDTTTKQYRSNFELVVGTCAVLFFGGRFYAPRRLAGMYEGCMRGD